MDADTSTDVSRCRILVADPGSATRDLTCSYLQGSGFTHVTTAADGIEALRQVAAIDPDLVVLDTALPGMDGLEVCRRVTRGDPRRVPVLIQTMFSGTRDRAAAFAAGATDFVTKPVAGADLVARISLHLTNRVLMRRLEAFRTRVAGELAVARAMQADLLPPQDVLARLATTMGIHIAPHLVSSSELGGDAWGVREIDTQCLAIFTADLSGHGVTSALNSFRLDVLMKSLGHIAGEPAQMLRELNEKLHLLLPKGHFATMFYGVIDTAGGTLTYAGAASTSPVLIEKPGAAPAAIEAAGLPLGARRHSSYHDRIIPFGPGATLLLYSDALIETANRAGIFWSEADICRHIPANADAATTLAALISGFRTDRTEHLDDDLTIIALQRAEQQPPPAQH